MGAIDIGPGAIGRSTRHYAYTIIDIANPADGTGTLGTFEVWAETDLAGFKIGTFYGSGTDYQDRDYENIGAVSAGSKQTFSGKNCSVNSGDYLGCYFSSGGIELDLTGDGIYRDTGDQFGGLHTYTFVASRQISIYGTGVSGWANIVAVNGVSEANIGSVNGVLKANIGKIKGVGV